MEDLFKSFDAAAILYWVVPGAFFILFRSFALKGAFPALGKDDVVAFIIVSVLYWWLAIWAFATFAGGPPNFAQDFAGARSIVTLVAAPALLGALVGLFERRDGAGRLLRVLGVRFLSPYATAWESVAVNLPPGAVLIVHLKDAEPVVGRWTNAQIGSAASTDREVRDLYLDEIGAIAGNNYLPFSPARGAYIAPDQIQFIEVVTPAAN